MKRIEQKPYPGRQHGTFKEEWISHRRASEWWYVTGTLFDEAGAMYSYQFTIIHPRVMGVRPFILHLGLTYLSMGKHYFSQRVNSFGKNVVIDKKRHDSMKMRKLLKNRWE